MKKRIVLTLALVLSLSLCIGVSFAEEVIKVGAGQPITGRFAFAGKHIHQGLMDSLTYAMNKVVSVVKNSNIFMKIRGTILNVPLPRLKK